MNGILFLNIIIVCTHSQTNTPACHNTAHVRCRHKSACGNNLTNVSQTALTPRRQWNGSSHLKMASYATNCSNHESVLRKNNNDKPKSIAWTVCVQLFCCYPSSVVTIKSERTDVVLETRCVI